MTTPPTNPQESEPREYWLFTEKYHLPHGLTEVLVAFDTPGMGDDKGIHVVEYATSDKRSERKSYAYFDAMILAQNENDKLKAELEQAKEWMCVNAIKLADETSRADANFDSLHAQLTEARAEIERYKTQAKTLDDAVDRMKSEADSNNSAYDELSMWLDEEKRATALQFREINELKAEIERLKTNDRAGEWLNNKLQSIVDDSEALLTTLASALEPAMAWDADEEPMKTLLSNAREALAAYESWKGNDYDPNGIANPKGRG